MKPPSESFALNDLQAVNLSISLGALDKLAEDSKRANAFGPRRSHLADLVCSACKQSEDVGVFSTKPASKEFLAILTCTQSGEWRATSRPARSSERL